MYCVGVSRKQVACAEQIVNLLVERGEGVAVSVSDRSDPRREAERRDQRSGGGQEIGLGQEDRTVTEAVLRHELELGTLRKHDDIPIGERLPGGGDPPSDRQLGQIELRSR
jgi:hypothetical protein